MTSYRDPPSESHDKTRPDTTRRRHPPRTTPQNPLTVRGNSTPPPHQKFSEEFFDFISFRATPPQIPLDTPVSEVMSTNLHPARPDMHRDDAAELLQREKIHHAIVVGEDQKFVGKIQNYRSDDIPPVSLPMLIL